MADFDCIFENNSVKLPELSVYKGRLKSKKQPAQPVFLAEPLAPTAAPSSLPWERVRERATSRKACIGVVKVLERLLQFGECPLPSPPPRGREQIAANSGVTGRLKKNARNINGRNFSGSLYRKADGTNAARFFQTTFEPIGRVCTARHARGGLELQGNEERVRTTHAPHAWRQLAWIYR